MSVSFYLIISYCIYFWQIILVWFPPPPFFFNFQFTDEEVERSYEEFYEDVHTEFLKFGEIVNFKVIDCCDVFFGQICL